MRSTIKCFFVNPCTTQISFPFLAVFKYHFIDNKLYTFQPVSFEIRDNGPPGSVTKILKSRTLRLLENVLLTITSMSK